MKMFFLVFIALSSLSAFASDSDSVYISDVRYLGAYITSSSHIDTVCNVLTQGTHTKMISYSVSSWQTGGEKAVKIKKDQLSGFKIRDLDEEYFSTFFGYSTFISQIECGN